MFTQNNIPRIYAYTDERFDGQIKVGYTTKKTAQERVREQMESVKMPRQTWKIVLDELAIRNDGSFFTDHNIHKRLESKGIRRIYNEIDGKPTEWFECDIDVVNACILAEKKGIKNEENRSQSFGMRPEQQEAVDKTAQYFRSFEGEEGIIPHFLWNAKMRFGKTFASYQLAKKMGWKKVLVLTFKPAVLSAWREDLQNHIDFADWQFVSNKEEDLGVEDIDRNKPFVYFGSFQDHLGKDIKTGGIKAKNEWVHQEDWDCVIFDEYHFGAWRDKSKDLFDKEKEAKKELEKIQEEIEEIEKEDLGNTEDFSYFDEALLPITTKHYLYLSGTPFRAIAEGEFIEEQIYNWTYSDEQKAKKEWQGENNPYASLPKMVMMTYQLPTEIQQIALKGEFNEFDLNVFFSAEGIGKNATFKYEDEVQKWLNLIRGQFNVEADLKLGNKKPPMPFSDSRLLGILQHTFWFLPNVASCYAMANLLRKPQNTFFNDYEIIISAGTSAGVGVEALKPVRQAMKNPLETKTITLSCGKLTTGVSVAPWSGILMLRNSSSPETYFQTIFRVQTPWVVRNPQGDNPNEEVIVKNECYVFDFAPNRALSQVASYSSNLNIDPNVSAEEKVAELVNFLPILAYDGSSMKEISAAEILDIASSGTTATLLARRWESALLVNVDNVTLQRLLNNEEAMRVLMNIEGFRSLNNDIETIINKSEAVKKAKKEATESGEELSREEKKQLSDEEKEYKNKRKEIQEKLIKFATRIPIFMYLSEHREQTLRDVITQLEPELFKKVTGLEVKDFELLEKLGLFNGALMNDAVLKFKHYEDSSLAYTGKPVYEGLRFVGAYDTIKPIVEYTEE